MVEIIPSINALTFEEVQKKIALVEPYVSWCHLDVTDGVFSKHPTWHNSTDLSLLDTKLSIEVHLMVQEPEKIINQWLIKPVKRVIVHFEASRDIDFIIEQCREAGIECGVAIRPDTPWDVLVPWTKKVSFIQVLAVNPGPSGQQMSEEIIEKVAHLRESCVSCMIEVDGGINPKTARQAREAGGTILVSAGYIFSHSNIGMAIKELEG